MDDFKVDIRLSFDNGGEVAVDLLSPFTIKQTRGLTSYMFTVPFRDISGFPPSAGLARGCKCKFKFSTPGESGGRAEAEWGVYLVRAEKSKAIDGIWNVTFADERWVADYRRFTGSYNLQWPDGSYRAGTIQGDDSSGGPKDTSSSFGGPWKAVDAFKDAVTKLGFTPDVSRVPESKKSILLPNNLGNSDGGGWAMAPWMSVLAPMLTAIDCDLIIGTDHKWIAVPRNGDPKGQIASLRAMKRIDDSVDVTLNGWEKPRKLRVGFEVMAEAALESEIADDPRATASSFRALPIFDVPDNVMQRLAPADFEPEAWWDANVGELNDTDWTILDTYMSSLGYGDNALVCRNWFLQQVIPFKRKSEFDEINESGSPGTILNAQMILKKLWFNQQLREHWRQTYRIVFPQNAGDEFSTTLRALSGLRFGRLTPGGDTRSRGSIYCDWCEETTHAVMQTRDPFAAEFSANHPFSPTRAAPMVAKWVAQSGNELIFQIKPSAAPRLGQEKIIPGLMLVPLSYGKWFNITSDFRLEATELDGTLRQDFDFRVYLAGLLTTEDPRGATSIYGLFEGRQLVVEVPMFPEGSIDSADIKVSSLTANFGYAKGQMALPVGQLCTKFPSSLLNEKDIRSAVERATAKMKEAFDLGNSGGIVIAGVSPISSGLITDGDIHEMSVIVGDPDPWSIKTQYMVIPGVSNIEIEAKERDGEKAALIAESS